MSSLLNFAIREHAVLHQGVISSGQLSRIFDPDLFDGKPSCVASWLKVMAEEPMKSFCPDGSGLVVLDLDRKTLWDVQVARELDVLSRRFDYSWQHIPSLSKRGWLGTGLVDTETGNVGAPYPEEGWGLKWYESQIEKAETKLRHEHPEMSWSDIGMAEIDALLRHQPCIPFAPLGWRIMALQDQFGNIRQLRSSLLADGFPVASDDLPKWDAWGVAMKRRFAR